MFLLFIGTAAAAILATAHARAPIDPRTTVMQSAYDNQTTEVSSSSYLNCPQPWPADQAPSMYQNRTLVSRTHGLYASDQRKFVCYIEAAIQEAQTQQTARGVKWMPNNLFVVDLDFVRRPTTDPAIPGKLTDTKNYRVYLRTDNKQRMDRLSAVWYNETYFGWRYEERKRPDFLEDEHMLNFDYAKLDLGTNKMTITRALEAADEYIAKDKNNHLGYNQGTSPGMRVQWTTQPADHPEWDYNQPLISFPAICPVKVKTPWYRPKKQDYVYGVLYVGLARGKVWFDPSKRQWNSS